VVANIKSVGINTLIVSMNAKPVCGTGIFTGTEEKPFFLKNKLSWKFEVSSSYK
jgi:hypothetical protein